MSDDLPQKDGEVWRTTIDGETFAVVPSEPLRPVWLWRDGRWCHAPKRAQERDVLLAWGLAEQERSTGPWLPASSTGSVRSRVLAALRGNAMTANDVAQHFGISSREAADAINSLLQKGKVVVTGERARDPGIGGPRKHKLYTAGP